MTADGSFASRLKTALARRHDLMQRADVTAWRALDGAGDGCAGLTIDCYGPAAVLNVDEDAGLTDRAVTGVARDAQSQLQPLGVEAVYVKPFVRDRSRLGGTLPDESRSPAPRAGVTQPASLVVEEYGVRFEVRPYDGLSTGLFLEHREHRRALAAGPPMRVLNLFAYTGGFSMPLAHAGAHVTNVDVSARYLEWGRRNAALNDVPADRLRFLRRDAREFLVQAARHAAERFDLVILDPPTFGAADRRRDVPAWRAVDDYPALIRAAVAVLTPGGRVFAATNTRQLAGDDALASLVTAALGRTPRWQPLSPWPVDVTARGRVAAVSFVP